MQIYWLRRNTQNAPLVHHSTLPKGGIQLNALPLCSFIVSILLTLQSETNCVLYGITAFYVTWMHVPNWSDLFGAYRAALMFLQHALPIGLSTALFCSLDVAFTCTAAFVLGTTIQSSRSSLISIMDEGVVKEPNPTLCSNILYASNGLGTQKEKEIDLSTPLTWSTRLLFGPSYRRY